MYATPTSDVEVEAATRRWLQRHLAADERLVGATEMHGGLSARMLDLTIAGRSTERSLVLRSFVSPELADQARGMLEREASTLAMLSGTQLPAARLVAVDLTADYCAYPSLLMSKLPGQIKLADDGAQLRADLMAELLVQIHQLQPPAGSRPRVYETWTTADSVTAPAESSRPELWRDAAEMIRRAPPAHHGCFIHRDFHPGNVLFAEHGNELRVSGVVDWVETSWGPGGLDVAHCATNLAILHGADAGMRFADAYRDSGGRLSDQWRDHLYWRLIDALGFAPETDLVAATWRRAGRQDLSDQLARERLEDYVQALLTTRP